MRYRLATERSECSIGLGQLHIDRVACSHDRQRRRRESAGVHAQEHAHEAEDLRPGELRVDLELGEHRVGQGQRGLRVVPDASAGRMLHRADEQLLASRPVEIGMGARVGPHAVDQRLEVATADPLECLRPVERLAPRAWKVETGEHVARGAGSGDADAAEDVDDLLEGSEVDLHVVVDRDAEARVQRRDEPGRPRARSSR